MKHKCLIQYYIFLVNSVQILQLFVASSKLVHSVFEYTMEAYLNELYKR